MTTRRVPLLLALVCCVIGLGSVAYADEGVEGRAKGDSIWLEAVRSTSEQRSRGEAVSASTGTRPEYVEYRWLSPCGRPNFAETSTAPLNCVEWRSCAAPEEMRWRLWGRTPSGRWTPLQSLCRELPPTGDPEPAQVTPAVVLEALRQIGLPAVQARTQPEDKTLVNFETIFYAEPITFRRTITLLGQAVEVEAAPTRYTWRPGDGTIRTTATPGRPYPATDVTHRYQQAHRTVHAAVDVTYTARYRVAGGGWRDIAETLTIPGPATPLRIAEATPVLSGDYS